jgi:uncharacterized Zn finger protein (UPF0148 family)
MVTKKAQSTVSAEAAVTPQAPQPGAICPCCGRKVPVNSRPAMTADEQAAKRKAYNQRPDIQAKRREYNKKRNAELKTLRELQRQLQAEAESETQDGEA